MVWFTVYSESIGLLSLYLRSSSTKNHFPYTKNCKYKFQSERPNKNSVFCFHYLSIPHPKILEKCKVRVIVESAHGFSKSTAISNGSMGSIHLMRARICNVIIYHSMMFFLRWFEFQLQFSEYGFSLLWANVFRGRHLWDIGYDIFPSATIWHLPVVSIKRCRNFAMYSIRPVAKGISLTMIKWWWRWYGKLIDLNAVMVMLPRNPASNMAEILNSGQPNQVKFNSIQFYCHIHAQAHTHSIRIRIFLILPKKIHTTKSHGIGR